MSELRKSYVQDKNLGAVKVAALERWEGLQKTGIEGFEITFKEVAPDMRDRGLWALLFFAAFLLAAPFLLLIEPVSTLIWISMWASGDISEDQKKIAYVVMAGSAGFVVLYIWMQPPFRSQVRVVLLPLSDSIEIYRAGRLVESAALSEVRGVSVEPHPDFADAVMLYEKNPRNWFNRRKVLNYKQTECVFLVVGHAVAMDMIEVCAMMGKKVGRAVTAMRVRAAIELCWHMAHELQRQAQSAAPAAAPFTAGTASGPEDVSVPPPRRRRRKGKIE